MLVRAKTWAWLARWCIESVVLAMVPQVKISNDGLDAIVELSGGDMRKAITAMQSASQFYSGEEVRLAGATEKTRSFDCRGALPT